MAARNFAVTVKESGDGRPWLLVQPDQDIGLEKGANIVMDLPDGADINEAQRVAGLLNDNLEGFRIARF